MDVDHSSQSISPVAGRKVSLSQHSSDAFSKNPVCSLSNTILVGLIAHCVLTSYAFSSKKGFKFP